MACRCSTRAASSDARACDTDAWIRPKLSSGQLSTGPTAYRKLPSSPSPLGSVASRPAVAPMVRRGKNSAFAAPTNADCAAAKRSAACTSGLACAIASTSPTSIESGKAGSAETDASSEASAVGARPSRTPIRCVRRGRQRRHERDRCARGRQLRGGTLGIERRAASRLQPLASEVERALLVCAVALRHLELLLCSAQVEVRTRHLGRDRHLHGAAVGLARLDQRALRPDIRAQAAEHIQLPRRISTHVPEALVRQSSPARQGTHRPRSAAA
jgi:hypothetical protein